MTYEQPNKQSIFNFRSFYRHSYTSSKQNPSSQPGTAQSHKNVDMPHISHAADRKYLSGSSANPDVCNELLCRVRTSSPCVTAVIPQFGTLSPVLVTLEKGLSLNRLLACRGGWEIFTVVRQDLLIRVTAWPSA